MIVGSLENLMNHENVDSRRIDLHRRIALVLRKEPGLVRDFAERLRSKLATTRSAAVVSDDEGRGISSSLCGPLCRLLDYWKIPANKPAGFARILHLSLCYLSLWFIASSNSPRYSGMLGEFSSVEIQRWNLLLPGFTLTSGPDSHRACDLWHRWVSIRC